MLHKLLSRSYAPSAICQTKTIQINSLMINPLADLFIRQNQTFERSKFAKHSRYTVVHEPIVACVA